MGLINLLTNPKNFKFYNGGQGYTGNGNQPGLTNIPYGKDQVGGGSSGQPYIQIPIQQNITNLGLANSDFILRGGALSTVDAANDVLRLTKMFGDLKSPNGLLFIAKQQILSRTAVRTQTSGVLNAGGYNPLGTLAQAGIVNIGGHLNKQGDILGETGAYATNNDALYGVKVNSTKPIGENRLFQLYSSTNNQIPVAQLNGVILNNGINVMTYFGGPNSVLGVTNTNIRYSTTSQTFLKQNPNTNTYRLSGTTSADSNIWLFSSKNINDQSSAIFNDNIKFNGGSVSSPKTRVDFRKYIRSQLDDNNIKTKAAASGQLAYSPDYTTKNIEQRVNLGDPGQRQNNDYSDYSKGVQYENIDVVSGEGNNAEYRTYTMGLDKINSLPIYREQNVLQDNIVNDLVKFRIAVIDNDSPNYKTFMHFRAFLGSINDSYAADWNPVQYLGRGEKFYNYNGFTRQLSLSWTVAAQSKQELIKMYKKLNYLASSLTPDYSSTGYMRGNIVQLTIGGYIYEQPGIITSLTYEIGEDTPWEIGINPNGGSDSTVKELPHIIRVTGFNFIPIQTFRPSIQNLTFTNGGELTTTNDNTGYANSYGSERYISLADGDGVNKNNYDDYGNTDWLPPSNETLNNNIILDNGLPTANA
jgi:hypothetical protein